MQAGSAVLHEIQFAKALVNHHRVAHASVSAVGGMGAVGAKGGCGPRAIREEGGGAEIGWSLFAGRDAFYVLNPNSGKTQN